MYRRILLPTDGSEGADAAMAHAFDLAEAFDATVVALYVASTEFSTVNLAAGYEVVDNPAGRRTVDAVVAAGDERAVEVTGVVARGEPATTIVEYAADEPVDLVVMPTHGRRGLDRYLFGSVTEQVLRRAAVPVLTVRMDDGGPGGIRGADELDDGGEDREPTKE